MEQAGMKGKDKGQAKITLLIGIALLLLIVLVAAQQLPLQKSPAANASISLERAQELAALNNKELDAGLLSDIQAYLERNNHFSTLDYQQVRNRDLPAKLTLTVGNRNEPLKGFTLNEKRYAVDLIFCDWQTRECSLLVNGMPTGMMRVHADGAPTLKTTVLLDNASQLRVTSITTDFCDHRRFCNTHFEAYDIVEVTLEER